MRAGLDIGSTTIKCVILDDHDNILFQKYERHYSHIVEKTEEMIRKMIVSFCGDRQVYFAISGSAGMGIASMCEIPFVQEVYADRVAANRLNPDTDCIIELGGEDAKILFLSNGMEVRMNGSCAGGTGAFIDQMSTLLKMDASELDKRALQANRTYTIASRCGVFAKSDIQPLINQGASTSDIAASIYQAVVNQTIAGLAQGRSIQGNILYLGGPLTFSQCLRKSFDKTLHVTGICPENSLYYVALGAAYYADQTCSMKDILSRMNNRNTGNGYAFLDPLFNNRDEYWKFHLRHAKARVPRVPFTDETGKVHIGIDSGSTTIKMAVIDENGSLLFTDYRPNDGKPLDIVRKTFLKLYEDHPHMQIATVTTTGYGEELMKNAFHGDYGIVETEAHFLAAKHFLPDVDFIIDIGGQDMKCFKIEDGAISDIFLNEACSSGCGSFLQTFAEALGSNVEDFAMQGLFAKQPVDLGSRCTVFMNSSVKQAQKDGATVDCISAGLSISIVKNALYKVIRTNSVESLGKNIVVQGGTFYNEAVLRAFEKEMGIHVIRPDIAGLMGAYGAALYGREHPLSQNSTFLSKEEMENFSHQVQNIQCKGCGNHCQLTINLFADGKRFISGNRCEKPVTGKAKDNTLNLYAYKRGLLEKYMNDSCAEDRVNIGIPLCLNMYELLPFWQTLFSSLGFHVVTSPFSSRKLYQKGQGTIPSDTACFPAKLSHGHIHDLYEKKVDYIFYPCMTYNVDEGKGENHYNCPVVAYYPEVLADNCEELSSLPLIYDYVSIDDPKVFTKKFTAILLKYFPYLKKKEIQSSIENAYAQYASHMQKIRERAAWIIDESRKQNKHTIILAGRPYHIDPEINHGIDELIIRQGASVITEDSISHTVGKFNTSVLNQWTYHSRLYAAAKYCTLHEDTDLVQLVSFGCGLDAITTDETREILQEGNKLYTQLKIDEITNTGAANIRLRSLFAALAAKKEEMNHGVSDA
ncbi:MAG: 2-hydroxyacyl-CoA dehydratase [Solobacterium sp.]|nr:2-hydroxyacyl-CoA dehydratase [Solobacterium sp.]